MTRTYATADEARAAQRDQQRAWRKANRLALRELRWRYPDEYDQLLARAKAGKL